MLYAPHTLERWVEKTERDEHGRLTRPEGEEGRWEKICKCRADLETTGDLYSSDRKTIVQRIKVTADLHPIKGGELVRVTRADGSVKGEGRVEALRTAEYLRYMSFYI